MLNILTNTIRNYSAQENNMIQSLEEQNHRTEAFFKEVENWRNLQLSYLGRLSQIANNLKQKSFSRSASKQNSKESISGSNSKDKIEVGEEKIDLNKLINGEFAKVISAVVTGHKAFLTKMNYDIMMVNFETADKLLQLSKKIIDDEKNTQKEINKKKEALNQVLAKKQKIKKAKEEEIILQIFMSDSIDITMDQKIRKLNKIKEIDKEKQQYELKVKQTIEAYQNACQKSLENYKKFKINFKDQVRCRVETVMKIELHYNTFCKSLIQQLDDLSVGTSNSFSEDAEGVSYNSSCEKYEPKTNQIFKKLKEQKLGYVETSLKLITENTIDDLFEYSKDKQVKGKFKKMMENNDANPEQTDEACRLVKVMKRILNKERQDKEYFNLFRSLINKNSKLRMNFVFIMQFFRLNSQFQISLSQIRPLHFLIEQFLNSCHENRDSFVLKQMMILLMTYYVITQKEREKIYIIHFYKNNPIWRDLEYWESVLIECIYLEKRNTRKMMLLSEMSSYNQKKQLMDAEKSAILNQILMVVGNMVIFEYSEKQVKNFALRFVKMLKQDEKCLKDVNNAIEDAIKQEQLLSKKPLLVDEFFNRFLVQKEEQSSQIKILQDQPIDNNIMTE